MSIARLEQQLRFLEEIDKLKTVFRQTRLLDDSRYENDAEHAWHLAVMALVLAEHANCPTLDLGKVIQMVLIHDLVEIDTGDTFLYDGETRRQRESAERAAAERLFGLLPSDQGQEMAAVWLEFQQRQTPEAKFAAALDRLQPILQNVRTGGHAWKKHSVAKADVLAANRHIAEGSEQLWRLASRLIETADFEFTCFADGRLHGNH